MKPFFLGLRGRDRRDVSLILTVLVSLSSVITIKHEHSQAHLMFAVVGGHRHATAMGGKWDSHGWPLAELSLRASGPCASPPDDITQLSSACCSHCTTCLLHTPLFSPSDFCFKVERKAAEANTVKFYLGENDSRARHQHGCVMMRLFVHSLPHLTFNSTYLIGPVGWFIPLLPQPYPNIVFFKEWRVG